jgi:hypothetical protein
VHYLRVFLREKIPNRPYMIAQIRFHCWRHPQAQVFTLRWERGKAAKRILPLVPAVGSVLLRRWTERGKTGRGLGIPG